MTVPPSQLGVQLVRVGAPRWTACSFVCLMHVYYTTVVGCVHHFRTVLVLPESHMIQAAGRPSFADTFQCYSLPFTCFRPEIILIG